MHKIKLLHITPDYPSEYFVGGQGFLVHEVSRVLVDIGFDVTVLAPQRTQNTQWKRLERYEEKDGIKIERVDTADQEWWRDGFHYMPPVLKLSELGRCRSLIKENDIIYFHNFWSTGFLAPLAKTVMKFKKKAVFSPYWENFEELNPPNAKTYDRQLRELSEMCDAVITLSYKEKEIMSKYSGSLHVVWGGIRKEMFADDKRNSLNEDKRESEGKSLISVGNFCPRKNYFGLIDAVSKLPEEYSLKIIGGIADQWYYDRCREKIEEKGLNDRIKFLGYVSEEELKNQMYRADLYVLPSAWESFGLAPLEAMATGAPALISDKTLLGEHFQKGEEIEIFPLEDIEHLDVYIKEMFRDGAKLREIGMRARKKVLNEFTWERAGQRFADILNEVYARVPSKRALDMEFMTTAIIAGIDERGMLYGFEPFDGSMQGRWAEGESAVRLAVHESMGGQGYIEFIVYNPEREGKQQLIVSSEDKILGKINLKSNWGRYRLPWTVNGYDSAELKLRTVAVANAEDLENCGRVCFREVRMIPAVSGFRKVA